MLQGMGSLNNTGHTSGIDARCLQECVCLSASNVMWQGTRAHKMSGNHAYTRDFTGFGGRAPLKNCVN